MCGQYSAAMTTLLVHDARILTLSGPDGARRGASLADNGVIERGWILCEHGRIQRVAGGPPPAELLERDETDVIDAAGNVVMPAFVDCHTHACWAGDRFDEADRRRRGASYLDILAAGGGIMSTVRAVRSAGDEELAFGLIRRISAMLSLGTGTLEVKSGYGLNTEHELRMLRIIHGVAQISPIHLAGTFLGAHAMDPDDPHCVERMIQETLPAVVHEFPGVTVDAYCELGAWSPDDCIRLFDAAQEHGCPVRVHADQFNALGMTRHAIEIGAVSVDHLEATPPDQLEQLAESATFGVMLPACGFHLDDRYAPGRAFVDAGGALALATNCNPGSAPTMSMPFIITLAARKLGLSPAEAITACTWNPAVLLGLQDQVGSIEPGKRADLAIFDMRDERELGYDIAGPGPVLTILDGRVVHARGVDRDEGPAGSDDDEEDDGEGEG